jgi:hypothetical protein
MKLVIKGISEQRKEIYQRAFRWLVDKFKIGHKNIIVDLTFFYEEPRHVYAIGPNGRPGFGLNSVNGETRNDIIDGVIEMRINDYKVPDPNSENRHVTHPQMQTFIHEMVHVAQIVTGNLVRAEDRYGNVKVRWRGEWMPLPAYEDMPWEHQANRLSEQLFEPLRRALKEKVAA